MTRMRSSRGVLAGVLIAALVVAGVLSFYASSSPDGLEKVAADKGLNAKERPHPVQDSALADYSVKGVTNGRASVGLAGIVGVVVVGGLGVALFTAIGRRRADVGGESGHATDIGA